jgi:hypothetical protein
MTILRVVFLEVLLCVHVIGAAVLFRRLFPRESPWLCFLVPTLGLLSLLNFVEHFVPLKELGWLLPVTVGGLGYAMVRPGYSWVGLRFPSILFVVLFTFTLGIKCLWPEISNGNEGVSNLVRILNYGLADRLPPPDAFLPPYDYGSYYSFQHYGAAILRRLFLVDLGTAYNLGFAFLLAWLGLMGAGVAHAITGKKSIAVTSLIVLLAGATGTDLFLIFCNPNGPDYTLSTNLYENMTDPTQNPFAVILSRDTEHAELLLQPPMVNLYWSEFHSTLGGNFIMVASILASTLLFRRERANWPWICSLVVPLMAIITSAWFSPLCLFLCLGSMATAWLGGARPANPRFVLAAAGLGAMLLWPFISGVLNTSTPAEWRWTNSEEHTPVWFFLAQWWPVALPWALLLTMWKRLDLRARWLQIALPLLFIAVEYVTFGDRKLTTEKMWAGIYGASLVTLVPTLFAQVNGGLRIASLFLFLNGLICFAVNIYQYYPHPVDLCTSPMFCRLQGDTWFFQDTQKMRVMRVMRRLHGAVILPGRSYWNYSQAAGVVAFSENMCWVAYTFNQISYGREEEANYRSRIDNVFYDGKLADPLTFLRNNNIAAVLIWPEDNIPDAVLAQFKQQLGPEFFYEDCKMDGPANCGVFFRLQPLPPDAETGSAAPNAEAQL